MKLSAKQAAAYGFAETGRTGAVRGKATAVDRAALFLAMCREHGLPEPQAEFEFAAATGRRWRADWCFGGRVLLEIEGGLFGKGKACPVCKRRPVAGHSSIERLLDDMAKYNAASLLGFTLVRCLPQQVDDGSIFPVIKQALEGTT